MSFLSFYQKGKTKEMSFLTPSCSPSSFRPRRRWGVFMNLVQDDVDIGFHGFLADHLWQKGMPCMAWVDYRPPRTTPVDKDILKLIQKSRHAVVVFSTNYACYPWCLDQLVKIMSCHKDKGLIVLPVFYHVDPLDVYNQTGTFGEHFNQHIARDQSWSTRVQAWSSALREAATNRVLCKVEGKTMEEIVQMISSGLDELSSSSTMSSPLLPFSFPARPRIKYDVFFNWTNDDVTQDFRGHLAFGLRRKEFYLTFLLEDIKDTRYAIVVFSMSYASDPESLDQLVKIMKCKKERGLIILPVFYNVDPSNVHDMNGTFGERFGQHIGKEKERSRLQAWSNALKEATKIRGSWYLFGEPGVEEKSIKEILQTILSGLGRKEEPAEEDVKLSGSSTMTTGWMYDVFLSFRGEDTRKNFVDHLYSALIQRGIHTYKDDEELERGRSIGPELLRAIRESRFAVIIFSKNYASSSWCLDEVVHIMSCMKERGQIVFPVFYDVDPSDVRRQKGFFGKAFDKQRPEKMEMWRKALVEAANLSGWEPKYTADGHQAKCVKQIVDVISSKLHHMAPSVDENLIGMDSRMQDVLVKVGCNNGVRMIGIWGMAGAGKTTVARAAFNRIFNEFDVRSFVEDVGEVSKKNGLIFLQQKILSLVDEKLKVDNVSQGIEMLKKRLCRKKVLLVLDDVSDREEIDVLAGAHNWFGEGSRIFITTGDEHVLHDKVDEVSKVELLNEEESNQLVNRYAFGSNKPKKGFEKYSAELVKYACGLPLALKVLGSFLSDKKLEEWKSALDRLRKIPDKKILEKLKVSYDGLSDDEKELFLDISCFFKGWKHDKVVRILNSCHEFDTRIGIKVLQQKCLVVVSNERIQMHDLIQEMGKIIGSDSRLWRSEEILDVLAEDKSEEEIKEIKGIVVDDHLEQGDVHNTEAFAKMMKLRLLHVKMQTCSPKSLPNELRWLSMHNYSPESLPGSFRGSKLVGLEMRHSSIGEIKALGKLKFLDLSFSKELTTTPDLRGILILERLVLQECEKLEKIESIGVLKCLVHLNLRGCTSLTNLPDNICELTCLKSLDLKHCSNLKAIRELPSTIAILDADYCELLTSVQALSKNYEWLWKVSFLGCSNLFKDEESQTICIALSKNMLNQGNAVVDHRLSVLLPDKKVLKWLNKTGNASIVLRISPNERNEILGVSLCVVGDYCRPQFRLHLSTEDNSIIQPLPGSQSDPCSPYTLQCYVSFDLLELSFKGSKWADWMKTTADIFLIISPGTTDVDIRGAYLVRKKDEAQKSTTTDSSSFGEKTRLVCSEETTNGNSASLLISGDVVCLKHSSKFKRPVKSNKERSTLSYLLNKKLSFD